MLASSTKHKYQASNMATHCQKNLGHTSKLRILISSSPSLYLPFNSMSMRWLSLVATLKRHLCLTLEAPRMWTSIRCEHRSRRRLESSIERLDLASYPTMYVRHLEQSSMLLMRQILSCIQLTSQDRTGCHSRSMISQLLMHHNHLTDSFNQSNNRLIRKTKPIQN